MGWSGGAEYGLRRVGLNSQFLSIHPPPHPTISSPTYFPKHIDSRMAWQSTSAPYPHGNPTPNMVFTFQFDFSLKNSRLAKEPRSLDNSIGHTHRHTPLPSKTTPLPSLRGGGGWWCGGKRSELVRNVYLKKLICRHTYVDGINRFVLTQFILSILTAELGDLMEG